MNPEYQKVNRGSENHDADPQRHDNGGQHPGGGQVLTLMMTGCDSDNICQVPASQFQGARGRGRECGHLPREPE